MNFHIDVANTGICVVEQVLYHMIFDILHLFICTSRFPVSSSNSMECKNMDMEIHK